MTALRQEVIDLAQKAIPEENLQQVTAAKIEQSICQRFINDFDRTYIVII